MCLCVGGMCVGGMCVWGVWGCAWVCVCVGGWVDGWVFPVGSFPYALSQEPVFNFIGSHGNR